MMDLVILGGGPAGYVAAERAAHAGLRTVVVERASLGGVCLNEGCIPSKALLNSAKVLHHAQHAASYGVRVEGASLDHASVIARKRKVVKTLVSGVTASVKAAGARIVAGEGAILGRVDGGYRVNAAGEEIAARRVLIATGSTPVLPPLPGVQEGRKDGFVITSREALELASVPARLVVVGGGVIGLEMAAYYASAGATVTVVEMLDHIGGPQEPDISTALQKELAKLGVAFHLSTKVLGVSSASVRCEGAGGAFEIPADAVLMSIGRRPYSEGIGLDELGVERDRGAVPTDVHGRTNLPGIYAAGDVNGKSMLAHTAYREAEVGVNHMLGVPDRMRYGAIPSVIYTSPEVAAVGHTSQSAAQAGLAFDAAQLSMRYSGRFIAENEGGDGFIKVLVERGTRRLIGVHMIGAYASEIIYGAAALIEMEMRVEDIRQIVFPHPTVGELLRETLFTI